MFGHLSTTWLATIIIFCFQSNGAQAIYSHVQHCNSQENKCYQFVTNPITASWYEAERYCEQHFAPNGHLASFHNISDVTVTSFWLPFASTNFLIGGIKFGNQKYTWTDGTPFNFEYFNEVQPASGNCLAVCKANDVTCRSNYWVKTDCTSWGQFICENGTLYAPTTPSPLPQPVGNPVCNPMNHKCFSAFVAHMTWTEAEQYCQANQTALAAINGPSDISLIESMFAFAEMDSQDIWLGAFKLGNLPFQWANGLPFNVTNWAHDQPIGSGCVKICSSHQLGCQAGQWVVVECTMQLSFICSHTIQVTLPPAPSTMQDCKALYDHGYHDSAVYTIHPNGTNAFQVYCDMSDGGGWTVIQRRMNGDLNFWNETWQNYQNGFNNGMNNSYWLGLDKIYWLTRDRPQLRTDIWGDRCTGWCGAGNTSTMANWYWYDLRDEFQVASAANKYRLYVSGLHGNTTTTGYGYDIDSGHHFTTVDQDNDVNSTLNCALANQAGAWWHGVICSPIRLNGLYGDTTLNNGFMLEQQPGGYMIHPKRSQIKIRRH